MSSIWKILYGNQKGNFSTTVTRDESIRGMEKIQNRLYEIMFEKFPMSSVPEDERTKTKERLDVIRSKIGNFVLPTLRKIESAEIKVSTNKVDVLQIESEILFFVQSLSQAISDGNIVKAEACMVGLGYGVQQTYKPIPYSNRDNLAVEMNMRFQKLEKYRSIVPLTQQIADLKNGIAHLQESFDKKKVAFDEEWEIYDAERKRFPERYQELKYLAGTQQKKLMPEQLDAYQKTNYIQNTSNELKRIKNEIAAVNISLEECEHQIENLNNVAIMMNFWIDDSLEQKIEETNSTITERINELSICIVELQEVLNRLQEKFNAVEQKIQTQPITSRRNTNFLF